ncbi:MAG: hypothetical protein J0M03_02740 [Acidobacteria bacterium]|nr:hypothetical protein [Acidobacteriota bacterium]
MYLLKLTLSQARVFIALLLLILMNINCTQATEQKPSAKQIQVGNVLYIPPQGWQKIDQPNGVVLSPSSDLNKTPCFIAILPGEDFQGDFRNWFDNKLEQLHKGSKVLVKGEITETTEPEGGYPLIYTPLVIENDSGQRSYRFYIGAHPAQRAELITYIAYSEQDFQKYNPVLENFLKTVDFANILDKTTSNKTVAKTKPAKSENALSGLYVGTESRQQFNPNTKLYDYIVRKVYYIFSPDGRVCYALPKGGALDSFDFDNPKNIEPNNIGSYEISNGQIQFSNAGGQANPPRAFTNNRNFLQIGNLKLYRVEPTSNLRLNGAYSVRTFTNTSSGNSTGGVSGENQLVFGADGRFSQKGFVGFAVGGGAGSNRDAGTGTYKINGNTLELTYSDGKLIKHTFFIYPENVAEKRPGLLIVDGASYLLRD